MRKLNTIVPFVILSALVLSGCGSPSADSASTTPQPMPSESAVSENCSPTQSIEEGPYYLADTPTRTDVTGGQAGQSLNLSFIVLDSSCLPVNGARVDIWYANADGIYSGVENQGDDFGAGKDSGNFLRGTQFTDSDGLVTFKGIYPGWYPSRTIHIHEKIWIGENEALTTQTYFSDDQNASVMSKAPYSSRGNQRVTNSQDMLIQRGLDLEAALMQFDGTKASFTFVLGS